MAAKASTIVAAPWIGVCAWMARRVWRTIVVVAAIAASAGLAVASSSPENRYYMRGYADIDMLESRDRAVTTGGTRRALDTDYEIGRLLGGALGHRFGRASRVEAVLDYAEADAKRRSLNVTALRGSDFNDASIASGYIDAFYDPETNSRLRPYIDAGLGYAQVGIGQSDDTAVGDRAMVGPSYQLRPNAFLAGGYRYRYIDSLAFNGSEADLDADALQNHGIEAGVRIPFGNPAALQRQQASALLGPERHLDRTYVAQAQPLYRGPSPFTDPRFSIPAPQIPDKRFTATQPGYDPPYAAPGLPPPLPDPGHTAQQSAPAYGAGQWAPAFPSAKERQAQPRAYAQPPYAQPPYAPPVPQQPLQPAAPPPFQPQFRPPPAVFGAPAPLARQSPGRFGFGDGAVSGGAMLSQLQTAADELQLELQGSLSVMNQTMRDIGNGYLDAAQGLAGPFPELTDPDIFPPPLGASPPQFLRALETSMPHSGNAPEFPSGPTGAFAVQLAAYRERSNAEIGWRALQNRHGDVIGGLGKRVVAVTLPGRGRFLRLYAVGLSDRGEAERMCRRLKSRGQYCVAIQL